MMYVCVVCVCVMDKQMSHVVIVFDAHKYDQYIT